MWPRGAMFFIYKYMHSVDFLILFLYFRRGLRRCRSAIARVERSFYRFNYRSNRRAEDDGRSARELRSIRRVKPVIIIFLLLVVLYMELCYTKKFEICVLRCPSKCVEQCDKDGNSSLT